MSIGEGKMGQDNRYVFQKLTPISNGELGIYEDAIDFVACQDIESVISDSDNVDRKLVYELMKSADIELNSNKELLLVVFSHLSREDIKAYLVLVEKEEFCRIFDSNTRPRYEDTIENRELLNAFVNRGWLYDYTPENGSLKVRRNQPKKSDANP